VHRWLAAIVESSDDAIIGKDLEGNIVSCNRGASQLFGYKREELIGKPATILAPLELRNEESKLLALIRHGGKVESYETFRRCKDGIVIPVSLTLSAIRDKRGKIFGVSGIVRDISNKKQVEKDLAESLAREKAAREAAEAANRAKDDFIAALSHELRTPLGPALLLASDAENNSDLSQPLRSEFGAIRKNIELEARLIDDLLDFTRITHGKLILNRAKGDVHTILRDAVSTVVNDIKQKKIVFKLDLRAARHGILGDSIRIQQIFWNVLKNAVKFTPEGGEISVQTDTHDGRFVAKISDTGIGMDPAEIGNVFGAFSQGQHHFGGLGLGLAISRALVEMHSGSIRAESPGKGKGATFTIELPALTVMDTAETKVLQPLLPALPDAGRKSSNSKVRILLVEDHEPTRTALSSLLSRRNYLVTGVGSLTEARSVIEKQKKKIHLLISDIGLPDGSGCELMEELQKHSRIKGIALTGYGAENDVNRSLAAGFLTHLTKPVRIESLDNALAAALRA
jgi:PAS domain S-box-containing protein